MIFAKTGKAVVFSPKRDIVVTVGPVQIGQTPTKNATQAEAKEPAKTPATPPALQKPAEKAKR
jgi:hypothetical protein